MFQTSLPSLIRLGNFERNSVPCPNRTDVMVPAEGRRAGVQSWWVPRAPLAVFLAKAVQAILYRVYQTHPENHSLDTQMGKEGSKASLRYMGYS